MSNARVTWYIYLRNLKVWIRQPAVVLPNLLINVLLFLVFGSTFTDVIQIPGFPADDYTAYITAMILVQAMIFSSGDAGFALLTDMVSGSMQLREWRHGCRSCSANGSDISSRSDDGITRNGSASAVLAMAKAIPSFVFDIQFRGLLLCLSDHTHAE